jgi:hypothetical protein
LRSIGFDRNRQLSADRRSPPSRIAVHPRAGRSLVVIGLRCCRINWRRSRSAWLEFAPEIRTAFKFHFATVEDGFLYIVGRVAKTGLLRF